VKSEDGSRYLNSGEIRENRETYVEGFHRPKRRRAFKRRMIKAVENKAGRAMSGKQIEYASKLIDNALRKLPRPEYEIAMDMGYGTLVKRGETLAAKVNASVGGELVASVKDALMRLGVDGMSKAIKLMKLTEADKPVYNENEIVGREPDNRTRLAAMDILFKISGDYAPTETNLKFVIPEFRHSPGNNDRDWDALVGISEAEIIEEKLDDVPTLSS